MSRFVRASKYRHLYGEPDKLRYEQLKVSSSAFDSNMLSVSASYMALNWQASGGGAFAVVPLSHPGRLPEFFPLCRAHTAPVLDTAWSPFNDSLVASAGEDSRIAITKVDQDLLDAAYLSEGKEVTDLQAIATAKMSRKAGRVLFHPTADNVLAGASYEVKLFDVNSMQVRVEMDSQPDLVGDMAFNYAGDGLATTCKDKKLRIYDTRSGGSPHTVAESHSGVKGSRVCWMGDLDRICTTGFSRLSDRQVFIWDTRKLASPVKQITVDTSAGTLMPFFNVGQNILFFAGKGDGNIRYYEYENDDLFALSEHKSSEPQRGMAFLPQRSVNVSDCEIARAYKVLNHSVEAISFIVPRKSESFQADIYPPTASSQPALSADDFFAGKTATPNLVNMEDQSQAPSAAVRKMEPGSSNNSTAGNANGHIAAQQTKSSGYASGAATPTRTSSAESPRPAASATPPVHPASSVADAGGIVPTSSSSSATAIGSDTPTKANTLRSASPPALQEEESQPKSVATPPKEDVPSSSSSSGELSSLQRENADLKHKLDEKEQLIKKLEAKVEQYKSSARRAREALSID